MNLPHCLEECNPGGDQQWGRSAAPSPHRGSVALPDRVRGEPGPAGVAVCVCGGGASEAEMKVEVQRLSHAFTLGVET